MRQHDPPPEVRAAFGPLVEWLVALVIETTAKQANGTQGPRYYDAKNAPMGKTAFLRLAAQNAFPSFKVGKKVHARTEDVHAYMEAQNNARPRARAMVAPVDVNDLSPAEAHELDMGRSLPAKNGKR
jgi:hypothetical protein